MTERQTWLDGLFRDYPLAQFIDQFFYRLPFSLPEAGRDLRGWKAWENLAEILRAANSPDVLVARANEQYAGEPPQTGEDALTLLKQGFTILVRHAERHHAGIAQITQEFAQAFQGPANAHIYATPSKQYGFSWHYDAEDVFILQLNGEKEYSLRKNTVNPWPLEETLPVDMQYERELMPLMRVRLQVGDLLYIPCGYWHRGIALGENETSISLAIGIMSPAAISIFDLLRPYLLNSLLWRQRLPVVPDSDSLLESNGAYTQLLESLAVDLQETLNSREFKEVILRARSQHPSE